MPKLRFINKREYFCIMSKKRSYSSSQSSPGNLSNPRAILIFGDSNTWGFNPDQSEGSPLRIPFQQRWTTIVQENLGHDFDIIPSGLNARTTLFDDPISPSDGEYNCNGRQLLPTIIHTYKPLSIIIIALGTNDTKEKFNTSPNDVVSGITVLVRDIQKLREIGESSFNDSNINIAPKKFVVTCLQ